VFQGGTASGIVSSGGILDLFGNATAITNAFGSPAVAAGDCVVARVARRRRKVSGKGSNLRDASKSHRSWFRQCAETMR
jgi:hypothetical protein